MKKGQKVEIVKVSHQQQFENFRPIGVGTKGEIDSPYIIGFWFLKIKDPKSNCFFRVWFEESDFKIIE